MGDGREKFGACITADSGNSVGEISGHSSQVNCVAVRQQRPFRAATGGDDTSVGFFHGAPYKFNTSLRRHARFVYGAEFSPDGEVLVTVGADKRIILWDGKTGEFKQEVGMTGDGGHTGSIFGVGWRKDSKQFVTCSADQTVRVWDAEKGEEVQRWRLGSEEGKTSIPDQQVGVVWPAGRSDGLIISLNLNGDLTYLGLGEKEPRRIVQGHQKNITAVTMTDEKTLFTGSSDGRVCTWDASTGTSKIISGDGHKNYISSLTSNPEGTISSVGWDDTLRSIPPSSNTFSPTSSHPTEGQPLAVSTLNPSTTIIATQKGLYSFSSSNNNQPGPAIQTPYTPTALSCSITKSLIAAGTSTSTILIFNASLQQTHTISTAQPPSTLSFSPSGVFLAAGFPSGKILVYDTESWEVAISRWSAHTGRVTSIAWEPSSGGGGSSNGKETEKRAVSGGLDGEIWVWSVSKPGMRVNVGNAHKEGVNGVVWVVDPSPEGGKGKGEVRSVGGDACVKGWRVEGVE